MTASEQMLALVEGSKNLRRLCREYETESVTVHLKELVGGAFSLYAAATIRRTGGVHVFHFRVDGGLFRAFGSTEIKDGDCDVSVALERGESMLTLDVNVDGSVVVECDRCLEDCNVPIHYEGQLLVKFSDEVHEYDGEVIWLLPMEDEVDLTQYIYESIVLALPYQRVHPDGECNPDMLERFRIVSDEEFGRLEDRIEAEGRNEGEWAKLAALKEQMEADGTQTEQKE